MGLLTSISIHAIENNFYLAVLDKQARLLLHSSGNSHGVCRKKPIFASDIFFRTSEGTSKRW